MTTYIGVITWPVDLWLGGRCDAVCLSVCLSLFDNATPVSVSIKASGASFSRVADKRHPCTAVSRFCHSAAVFTYLLSSSVTGVVREAGEGNSSPNMTKNTLFNRKLRQNFFIFPQNPAREAYSGHLGVRKAPSPQRKGGTPKTNFWLRLCFWRYCDRACLLVGSFVLLVGRSWHSLWFLEK